MEATTGSRPLRVAIVGLGPKGLFALERLLAHTAAAGPGTRFELDAFEPHPVPGAGPVYDPNQPAYLRMNFTAGALDMWCHQHSVVPATERLAFVPWSRDLGRACDRDDYPPRSDVGRYLACGLAKLLDHAPPNTIVRVHAARVQGLDREGSGWRLAAAGWSGGRSYDEVLVATGHERSWAGGLTNGWPGPPPRLIPAVFPVETWCSPARIQAGATVAVRGFALTFIDAALALTEGRGGSFEPLEHAYRLRYVPGGEEVRLILPFSRTGRPMLAKPSPRLAAGIAGLETIAQDGRGRVAGLTGRVDLRRDLLPILVDTVDAIARAATGPGSRAIGRRARLAAWFAAAAVGRPIRELRGPVAELEHSLAVGAGLLAPDLQWALGHAWRALYPALVARLAGDGLASCDWPDFRRLAGEMERLAFGPGPINAAKILALIDAGRIDLRHAAGGCLLAEGGAAALRSRRGQDPVDVVLDGVLPGPGAEGRSELLGRLLAHGHARVAPGRRGLDVGPDGSCRAADGTTTPGLAAIGRPTEDSVIGNDTLNRRLHGVADLWARRVASVGFAPQAACAQLVGGAPS